MQLSVLRWLDWFVPEDLEREGPDAVARARVSLVFCLIALVTVLLFIPGQFGRWSPDLGVIGIAIATVIASVPFLLRATGALRLVGNLIAAIAFAYCCGMIALTGGQAVGAFPMLAVIPLAAVMIAGGGAGLFWSALTCSVLIATSLAVRAEVHFPVQLTADPGGIIEFQSGALTVALTFALAMLYETLRRRGFEDAASARARADEAFARMRKSEERYRALIENASDGITILGADGAVRYRSPAVAHMLGMEPEDLEGGGYLSHVHPDDHGVTIEALRKILADPSTPTQLTVRVLRPDGSVRVQEVVGKSFLHDPAIEGVVVNHRDVTERRLAEDELQRYREQLESLVLERTRALEASQASLRESERLASVGTLAAGVAHQINNPVGSILAGAEYALLCEGDPDATSVWKRSLLIIRDEAQRCGKIVRSVLQFSREETTEKWPEDVNAIARRACAATSRYATERDARVELQTDPAVARAPAVVNPIEIEQVLVNLLRNAIESRDSGARVVLSTARDGEDILLCVRDNGRGIDAEQRSRIFDPFFTTRLTSGGTGLGLSVAHGIVRDHGGTLSVDALPEGGTQFAIRLPSAGPRDAAAGSPSDS